MVASKRPERDGAALKLVEAMGWFSKKKLAKVAKGAESAESAIGHRTVEIAEGILSFQLGLIADEFGRLPASVTDDFSLGYVVGFLDALMQRAGVQDEGVSFAMLSILMMKLFGEDTGADLSGRFLNGQHLPETQRGLMAGGSDSLAWLNNPDQWPPHGWSDHCDTAKP
jgi:hypothetical protein